MKCQKNARGSALLNAIIVAGIVAGVAGIIMSQTQTTDKMSRNPRIKSAMTVLETQMLSMAMQPGIYQGCSAQAQNCQLNSTAVEAFRNLSRNITGANCGTGSSKPGGSGGVTNSSAPCGVKVQAPSGLACLNAQNPTANAGCLSGQFYNPATQTFCAEIVYQGSDVAMQPMCASTTVPQSVLQGDATACNSAANLAGPYPNVIFKGYDGAGNAVCSRIPTCSGGDVNNPGNYITAIDKLNLQTQCKSIGLGSLSCPPGTVLMSLKWHDVSSAFGSISVTGNCVGRRMPADIHRVQAITAITNPPTTYTVTPTTVPSPPTTVPPGPPTLKFASCFVAGTKVSMADGSKKNIEDVQVGDQVLTYDESKDHQTISPVVQVLHHAEKVNDLYTFTFSDGTSVTSNDVHPYYLPDYRQYAAAAEIYRQWNKGYSLRLLNQKNQIISVAAVKQTVKSVKLYNLHVSSVYDHDDVVSSVGHNYYAGGVLVHNLKCLHSCNNQAFGDQCCQKFGGTSIVTDRSNNATSNCYIDPSLSSSVNACVNSNLAVWPDADCPGPGCSAGCELGPCSGIPVWYGVGAGPPLPP